MGTIVLGPLNAKVVVYGCFLLHTGDITQVLQVVGSCSVNGQIVPVTVTVNLEVQSVTDGQGGGYFPLGTYIDVDNAVLGIVLDFALTVSDNPEGVSQ